MLGLLATFWFWLIVIEIVILFTCVARETTGWATLSIIAFGCLLYWAGGVDFITYFREHPGWLYYGIPGYFLIGFGWSLFRWVTFLLDRRTKVREQKERFCESKGFNKHIALTQKAVDSKLLDQETLNDWKGSVWPRDLLSKPKARNYKYKIVGWLAYWPFSLVWYVVDDLVRKIANTIYNLVQGLYQSISNKIFADFDD